MKGIDSFEALWAPPRGYAFAVAAQFDDYARASRSLAALGKLIGSMVRSIGFSHFALVQHASLANPPPGLIAVHNYPRRWARRFADQALHLQDPVHQAAAKSFGSFAWARLPDLIDLRPAQQRMLVDAMTAGLGTGFTVPLRAPAERIASCSFIVPPGAALPKNSLMAAECIAHSAYLRAMAIVRAPERRAGIALSPRQTECLGLAAQGKSDWEIGTILGLSEETVTKYLGAARARFGVSTRTQLALAAIGEGLLGLDELLPRQ